MVEVAAAILRRKDSILICRRAEGGDCSLLWEFPGGKREPGETAEACAVRECAEELCIQVHPTGVFAESTYRYPERDVHIVFLCAEIVSGHIRLTVHKEGRWAKPSELKYCRFCPADAEVVKRLEEQG